MKLTDKLSVFANNAINIAAKKALTLKKTPGIVMLESSMLTNTSQCLAARNRAQVVDLSKKAKIPDIAYLRQMTHKYSQNDLQIAQTKKDVIDYLKQISDSLSMQLNTAKPDEIEEILGRKAVVDYMSQNIDYSKNFIEGCGFTFGLPTRKITKELTDFDEEFNKSVELFKKEGIFDVSMYDPKKYQFDAENIMKKYNQQEHRFNDRKYQDMFHPIQRMRSFAYSDPYLTDEANFYRTISPNELVALFKTKGTSTLIDSNGHYTNGHYSCITTNPNYNEQAFAANGLPIRLKFKTKDNNGLYNMDLLDRISGLKQERSIYRVSGYNYSDIDWDNICVDPGSGWVKLGKETLNEIMDSVL